MADAAVLSHSNSVLAILRQAGVLVGIAASVALGVYVVMWARTPNYSLLYADLADRDITEIADTLKADRYPLPRRPRLRRGLGCRLAGARRPSQACCRWLAEKRGHGL